jgi:hypothetical protein
MRLYARCPHGTRYLHSDRQQRLDHFRHKARRYWITRAFRERHKRVL